jgi:hypothetical protein
MNAMATRLVKGAAIAAMLLLLASATVQIFIRFG